MINRSFAKPLMALGAAVLFLAAPGGGHDAHAADLYVPAPEPVIEAPARTLVYDWSGLYAGGHGGWSWMDSRHRDAFLDDTHDLDGDTFVGGVLGGVNIQSGSVVYGLEADFTFGNLRNRTAPVAPGVEASFDLSPVGTIRARLGYAIDRTLLYITAGLGIANPDLTIKGGANGGNDARRHLGIVGGAGIEYAVTDAILLRTEYLYGNYGKKTYHLGADDVTTDFETSTVRAGVSFKLDPALF